MAYVVMTMHASLGGGSGSFDPLVKSLMEAGGTVVHVVNCSFHCLTLELLMHMMMQLRLMVDAAVTPVSDLPAPHGRTMMPDRARPLPNILDSERSWYGRMVVDGRRSICNCGFLLSLRKSYSSISGYLQSSFAHRFTSCTMLCATMNDTVFRPAMTPAPLPPSTSSSSSSSSMSMSSFE